MEEKVQAPQLPASIVPTAIYGELHPVSSKVPICLRDPSAHPTMNPVKAVVGSVGPANQVPPVTPMKSLGKYTHGHGRGGFWMKQTWRIGPRKSKPG